FITVESDGYKLNGYIIKPVDFDPNKKYPVIMQQYSGPGSQQVLNKWSLDWQEYFATQGFIIACVDGRGTGGREKAFQSVVYQKLGKYESIDQIAAAKYMASLPYVDAEHIGIWGWSYGGYEALMAMSTPGSDYAAGVAIAPVTSWKFYDTIYAERYMRTPQENPDGYRDGAPLENTDKLKGKLLIMWGSADDNVHVINSMQYISKLHGQGNQFDMMIYPNMNHSINGCGIRLPLYQRVLNFFKANLQQK
ncbi:MAG: S9 family peptidase, partial [Sodaliphilus sp.]|nr:S9 family peptidase [Sodaliphilus sp.]